MKNAHAFPLRRTVVWPVAVALPLLSLTALAQTLPTGGRVTAGQARIESPAAGAMVVRQTTPKAVVRWGDFNIGAGGKLTFAQPDARGATLNIVEGGKASAIAGTLRANGSVLLVNPSGIAITPTGLVDTQAGFIASTLAIAEDDFLNGRLLFTGKGAAVINQGRIVTGAGGFVGLLGSSVSNEALIRAPLGKVMLGAAERATLDLSGDGFLQVLLPAAAGEGALVANSGSIQADGGSVTLKAATVREALREAVHMPGEIRARSVSGRDGAIVLDGGAGGKVQVAGRLDASGDELGGRIDVTGQAVALQGAAVAATGAERGGLVRIGGAFQGGRAQEPGSAQADLFAGRFGAAPAVGSASTTTIDAASRIDVSASAGRGGAAIVWSDDKTVMQGAIDARGPAGGGAVEISSKSTIQSVALPRVAIGKGGTLLLDPQDIVIDTVASAPAGDIGFTSPSGGTTNLNGNELFDLLAGGTNVSLQASQDINWSNAFYARSFTATGGNLTMTAGRSVLLSGVFTMNDGHWSITANAPAAMGVVDGERGAGGASIDLGNATFIGSNGRLSLVIDKGTGNTNNLVQEIRIPAFNGNGLTASIDPTTTAEFGNSRIMLTGNVDVATDITLTGTLQVSNDPVLKARQSITWTNERLPGSTIGGEGGVKFVVNEVTTRVGKFGGFTDPVRLEVNTATVSKTYGDADPGATTLGVPPLKTSSHNVTAPTDPLDTILSASSFDVLGPGVSASVGSSSLTIGANPTAAMVTQSVAGYFVDLTPKTLPLTITQRVLTPTVTAAAYTYGSPTPVVTLANIKNSDPIVPVATLDGNGVNLEGNGAGFGFPARTNAGTRNFTLSGIAGTGAGNYTIDLSGTITRSLAIAPKALTFTMASTGQTYGTLGSGPFGILNGIVSGDTVDPVYSLDQGGTPAMLSERLAAGAYTAKVASLTGSAAANYSVAGTGNTSGTYTVSPKAITYSVGDTTGTYGTLAFIGSSALTGVLSGDDVAGTVALTSGGTPVALTATTPAGSYLQSVSALAGAHAGNYSIAGSGNTDGTLTINRKSINFVGGNVSQEYGQSSFPSPPLVGVVGGDTVTAVQTVSTITSTSAGGSGAFPAGIYDIGAGGLTGPSAANYQLAAAGNTPNRVTITPKPLTFSVPSVATTYGTAATLPAASLGGLVPGDVVTSETFALNGASPLAVTALTPAGTYPLSVSLTGQTAGNYSVATTGNTAGNLSIARKLLTWQVGAGTAVYGDALANPVTFTGLVPNEVVGGTLAALDGGGVAIARPNVGTHPVAVTGMTGDARVNYELAPAGHTQGSVVVTQRPLTYAVASTGSTYGTLAATGAVTLNNVVAGDTVNPVTAVSSGGSPVVLAARSPAGSYTVGVSGTDNANYLVTGGSNGTLTIAPKAVTFTTANANSTYGTPAVLPAGTLAGVLGGDSVNAGATVLAANGQVPGERQAAGTYPLNVGSLTGTHAANYAITTAGSTQGNLTVAPKEITYGLTVFWNGSPTGAARTYGELSNFNGFLDFGQPGGGARTAFNGVLSGDTVGLAINNPAIGVSSVGAYRAGTYQWTGGALNGQHAGNYVLAATGNTDATLTITPKVLSAIGFGQSTTTFAGPVYGSTGSFAANAQLQGVLVGDRVTADATFTLPTGNVSTLPDRVPVGTYPITINGLTGSDAANYALGSSSGSITVTPKPVTIQVANSSSTYGTTPVVGPVTVSGALDGDDVSGAPRVLRGNQVVTLTDRSAAGGYAVQVQSLTGAAAANYSFSLNPVQGLPATRFGNHTINRLTLGYAVDPTGLAQVYGGHVPTPALTGVLSGDTVAALPQARPISVVAGGNGVRNLDGVTLLDVGSYDFIAGLTGAQAGNYALPASSFGTISIAPRVVTLGMGDRTTTYGTLLAPDAVVHGLIGGQAVTPVIAITNAAGTAVNYNAQTDAGTYTARVTSLSGPTAPNYQVSGADSARLTITPKAVTVTANANATSVYGSPATIGSLSGLLFGDDVGVNLVTSGTMATGRLTPDSSGSLVYTSRLNAGHHTFTLGSSLVGTKAANYSMSAPGGGALTVAPKPLIYAVDNATAQYGNFKPCADSTCYPWTPGAALGTARLSGVLAGDTVAGTVGLLDLNGNTATLNGTTKVGRYFEVVTGLTGTSASNYAIATSGSLPGVFEVTPAWLTYTTTSAVYLPTTGLVGFPGIPTLRTSTGGLLNGDQVEGIVVARGPTGAIVTDLGKLQTGRYFFAVEGLSGPQAGNYRIKPGTINFAPGTHSANDVGTLDVFADSKLGLPFAKVVDTPKVAPVPPPPQPPRVSAPDPSGSIIDKGTGNTTEAGRTVTATGTAGTVQINGTGVGASGTASGVTTASTNVGAANLSAQASGATAALARAGITGVNVEATAGGHVDVQVKVGPGYVQYGLQGDAKLDAQLSALSAKLNAEVKVQAYSQTGAEGSLGGGASGKVDATASTFVYAQTENAYSYKDGKIQAKLDHSAGVGASVGTHGGVSGAVGSVDAGVTLYSPGVVGAKFDWTGGYSNGALTVGIDLGAKIGIGGLDLSINFTVDPDKMFRAIGSSDFAQGLAGAFGMTGGPSGDNMFIRMNKATEMKNDPAGRFAILQSNPDWKTWQSSDPNSTFSAQYRDNVAFYNSYQSLLKNTADAVQREVETQKTFMNLLATDPKKAVEFAHAGNLRNNDLNSIKFQAQQLGVKLTSSDGKLAFVNK